MSASTHTLPPSVLASYLTSDLGCQMALIGIQPASLEMGHPLSPAVEAAVDRLAAQTGRVAQPPDRPGTSRHGSASKIVTGRLCAAPEEAA